MDAVGGDHEISRRSLVAATRQLKFELPPAGRAADEGGAAPERDAVAVNAPRLRGQVRRDLGARGRADEQRVVFDDEAARHSRRLADKVLGRNLPPALERGLFRKRGLRHGASVRGRDNPHMSTVTHLSTPALPTDAVPVSPVRP